MAECPKRKIRSNVRASCSCNLSSLNVELTAEGHLYFALEHVEHFFECMPVLGRATGEHEHVTKGKRTIALRLSSLEVASLDRSLLPIFLMAD